MCRVRVQFKDGMHLHVTHLRKCPYRLPLPVPCSAVQLAEAPRPDYSSDLGGGIGGSNRTRSGASPSSTLSTRELKLIEIRGLFSSVPFLFPLPRLALLTTRQSV